MKKDQFIQILREHLTTLPPDEVNDIVRDQEEFLRDAMAAGRSEEEAVTSLGDPKMFASSLQAESKLKTAEQSAGLRKQVSSTFSAVLAVLALAPLNVIFVFGPFLFACFLIFMGWCLTSGLFIASWAVMIGFLTTLVFMSVGAWAHLSMFFFTLGSIGATFLSILVMVQITRFFVKGTLGYLRWNIQLIQGQKN